MLLFAFIFFAACVLTVVFWAAVVAAAVAVIGALWLVLQAVWWLVTRPIVWLVIRPVQFVFGSNPAERLTRESPAASSTMNEKVENLAKIKTLLEGSAITQGEFDKMKSEILAR